MWGGGVLGERRIITGVMIEIPENKNNELVIQIVYIGFFMVLCCICLLFNLQVKSDSPDINVCAFLCIEHRTNDFQKAENVCVTFKKW